MIKIERSIKKQSGYNVNEREKLFKAFEGGKNNLFFLSKFEGVKE